MKSLKWFACGALVLALTAAGWSTVIPVFEPAEFITWGVGQVIQTEHNGVIPNVGDWNGDGVKDLFVGTYTSGALWYYPNTGTNDNPVFLTRTQLTADGSVIALTYG